MTIVGCRDDQRYQTSEVRTGVVAPNAAPAEVTRALLTRLAKAQNARARGIRDPAVQDEYDTAMAEIRGLAARKAIFDRFRAQGGSQVPSDLNEESAVRTVTNGWVSICAHYADRLDYAKVLPAAVNKSHATVVADIPPVQPNAGLGEAADSESGTRIVVRLALDSANSWGVDRVELESPSVSVVGAPASQAPILPPAVLPATRPAG